jgi:hypothetical protein
MTTEADGQGSGRPAKQEWDLRWLGILVATALIAGALGYVAGGGPSKVHALTGNAYAGTGQISALASDGITYAIPLDTIDWVDSKGTIHSRGRAECLPADLTSGTVKFVAVEWTLDGLTRRNVVWVNCRS